jgi:hypothetical protein
VLHHPHNALMRNQKMSKLVYGVGHNDTNTPARINGKLTKQYILWQGMLSRCYSRKTQKMQNTYIGCYVSENFKSRAYFEEWCRNQQGFNLGWNLDKDLLFKHNKLYSESTCVFLPKEINLALTKRQNDRGLHPIGVYLNKPTGMFISSISKKNKRIYLGLFNNEKEAFLAYKTAKEDYLKELANLYAHILDKRAHNALINYIVEIND